MVHPKFPQGLELVDRRDVGKHVVVQVQSSEVLQLFKLESRMETTDRIAAQVQHI